MTQEQSQEESDQQENGDEWCGAGNRRCGVPCVFRRQKTDQQWAVHRNVLSHGGSLPYKSASRVDILTLGAPRVAAVGHPARVPVGIVGAHLRHTPDDLVDWHDR